MSPGRIAVIGAGPTGLGAAYRLLELGSRDVTLFEASGDVGGLAASHVDARGFTWDIGGHVQFSHYPYFDALMDRALPPAEWLRHERQSWVWVRGRFVPYPFQYNVRHLPEPEARRCVEGLDELDAADGAAAPAHFGDWIVRRFGRGIADVFMTPYNLKVWAYPLEQLSYGWIGERVAVVDPARARENVRLGRDDTSWGPNNAFRFPRRGGTGEIWRRVADLVGRERIRLRARVVGVDASRRRLRLADGSEHAYDALLNTAPLDVFTRLVDGLAPEVARRAAQLKHSTTHVVGVGLRGRPKPELARKCWMYFPESDCPFYRVTVFSNYSPQNVPRPGEQWSLLTETSASPAKTVDESALEDDVIRGLLATGLIGSRTDVVSVWRHAARYGYPTPSLDRDAILADVQPALERLGLYSRGRFGAWKYEVSNQDHSLMQGVEWADRLLSGKAETTLAAAPA